MQKVYLVLACFFIQNIIALPKLYLIGNKDFYDYLGKKADKEIQEIKQYLEKKNNGTYFSSIEVLEESPKIVQEQPGDYFVFFFGWRGEKGKSTIFLRSDATFNAYRDLDRKKNPIMVILIPLDNTAQDKLSNEYYLEFLQLDAKNLKEDNVHRRITYKEINKLPENIETHDYFFVIDWLKEQQKEQKVLQEGQKNNQKEIEEKKRIKLQEKQKEERDLKLEEQIIPKKHKLYLIGNKDLYDYLGENKIQEIKQYLEKQNNGKYFSLIEVFKDKEKTVNEQPGDCFVFLFGWRGEGSKSTVFLRSDSIFHKYKDIDRQKNPVMVIFIPLDNKAQEKLNEKYIEMFQLRSKNMILKNNSDRFITFKEVNKLPTKINPNDFSFIIDWAKEEQHKEQKDLIEQQKLKNEELKNLEKQRAEQQVLDAFAQALSNIEAVI